jgi:pimeloyl-ACP methyl ester carboxylesterase
VLFAPPLLTITAGRRLLASLPRTGSRSTTRGDPYLFLRWAVAPFAAGGSASRRLATAVPHVGDSSPNTHARRIVLIVQLVLLHALPLDGTMWADEMQLRPDATIAPTLYSFGESIVGWARAVLNLVTEDAFVVVGNSVGGSCSLEIARQDPGGPKPSC